MAAARLARLVVTVLGFALLEPALSHGLNGRHQLSGQAVGIEHFDLVEIVVGVFLLFFPIAFTAPECDRRLAAIEIVDVGRGQMHGDNDLVTGLHPLPSKHALQSLTSGPELTERIDDGGREIDAREQHATSKFGGIGEGDFDHSRDVPVDQGSLICEAVRVPAELDKAGAKIVLADDAEVGGFDIAGPQLHRGQQLGNVRAGLAVLVEQITDGDAMQAGRVEYVGHLGTARQTPELSDELAHGAVAVLVGIGGQQSPEAGAVIPVRRGRLMRSPLAPVGIERLPVQALAVEGDGHIDVWIEQDVTEQKL